MKKEIATSASSIYKYRGLFIFCEFKIVRMKRFTLLLVLMCLFAEQNLHAQKKGQALIDSFLTELNSGHYKINEDTNKVKLLSNLSYNYSHINPDEGIEYGQQGLDLATNLNWQKGTAMASNSLGNCYLGKSDYPKAVEFFKTTLKTYQETGNKKGIVNVTTNIGQAYGQQGNYAKALEYFFLALKMAEETGDKNAVATNTCNIGSVCQMERNYPQAREYFMKAIKLSEDLGDKQALIRATINTGTVYYWQKNYDKALEYDFMGLKMAEDAGVNVAIAKCYSNIGNVYTEQKNYTMAITYMLKGLKIDQEIKDKYATGFLLKNIGFAYLAILNDTNANGPNHSKIMAADKEMASGPYQPDETIPASKAARIQKAMLYLQQALDIAKEIKQLDIQMDCYEGISEVYKLKGDLKNEIENFKKYSEVKDSLFSKDNTEQITKLNAENEYNLKQQADSLKIVAREKITAIELRRQRTYTLLGIGGTVLLLGFSFFMVKARKKSELERKKSDELLLNILPSEVAAELKSTGVSEAKYFDHVTVIFTDFVNFTKASETLSPKELVNELHTCFKMFDEIISKYGIEKIKTIGDAYLAVSGLPVPDPKHAENVVRAALEIVACMRDRQANIGDRAFQVRVGIHSGNAVAGIVGVKKFAYDIWGDTVNTAARMEQSSEAGKINISEVTYELVKDKFNCRYRGEIDAKNKGQMKMYFVS